MKILKAILALCLVSSHLQAKTIEAECNRLLSQSRQIIVQRQSTESDEFLLDLLRMAGQTRDHLRAAKEAEKGQIYLARELSEGFSIEAEYIRITRRSDSYYRLNRLEVRGPDDRSEVLTDRPWAQNGTVLQNNLFSYSHPLFKQDVEVSLPYTIEGPQLRYFLIWAQRMEFLTASELRSVNTEKDRAKLYRKFVFRDQKALYGDRGRKEYSKLIFTVAALMGANYLTAWLSSDSPDEHTLGRDLLEQLKSLNGQVIPTTDLQQELMKLEMTQGQAAETRSFQSGDHGAAVLFTVLYFEKAESIVLIRTSSTPREPFVEALAYKRTGQAVSFDWVVRTLRQSM